MKFKITVISLLTAILAICLITSYTLIDKANKQFELQKLHIEIELEQYGIDHKAIYYVEEIEEATNRLNWWRNRAEEIYEGK